MDSATGWILGVCGTLIGGVILLFIEQRWFQKRKQAGEAQQISTEEHLLWQDVIDKAVHHFSKNHLDSTIKIKGWSVLDGKAQVDIHAFNNVRPKSHHGLPPSPQVPTRYVLIVDRAGDISEIRHR